VFCLPGFVAGTIDIGAACLINRLGLIAILQAIASGLLGRDSFHSGLSAAALGLVLPVGDVDPNSRDFHVCESIAPMAQTAMGRSCYRLWRSDFLRHEPCCDAALRGRTYAALYHA
jgi:hypothetical protein